MRIRTYLRKYVHLSILEIFIWIRYFFVFILDQPIYEVHFESQYLTNIKKSIEIM